MPASSLIIGVDLAPIKPIPRTITFQSDITTDKCRATIRQHLKSWKADTVLHDGAPNVGTAWVQDAFSQAELVLEAFKLATEFLIEGGTFVTKVFRSKDYNALLWIFNQLFNRVEATKPPSSRNVSAEIFVVCRGFKAPKRIDPKFLDPRSVFAELSDPTPNNEAKVFNPEKKKRKRDGYEEGDYIQFKEVPASDFIQTTDPIAMLGSLNKFTFEQKTNGDIALAALKNLPETTAEIMQCCLDLKVLGRKEFRMLLRWRLKAREKFGFALKEKSSQETGGEEITEVGSMDEELKIQEELQRLDESKSSRKRREKRRANERKQKEVVRMQMHMMPPTEIGLEQKGPNGEDSMFALTAVDKAGATESVVNGHMGVELHVRDQDNDESSTDEESDNEEDRLDRELDALYSDYQERKLESDAKYRAKKSRKEHDDGDWEGFTEGKESGGEKSDANEVSGVSSDDDEDQTLPEPSTDNTLWGETHVSLTSRASNFFEQDIFKDIGAVDYDLDDNSIANKDLSYDSPAPCMPDSPQEKQLLLNNLTPKKTLESPGGTHLDKQNLAGGAKDSQYKVTSELNEEILDANDDNNEFEVVQDVGKSVWEEQGEPRTDGRLGK